MTKDRGFFSNLGIYKQGVLNSLCDLLDKKGIDYDTRELAKLSREEAKSLKYKYLGKKPNPTQAQTNSYESRGRINE